MGVLEFLRDWPALILAALNIGFAGVVWVVRKTLATKDDVDIVATAVRDAEARVASLEQARETTLTRDDLSAVRVEMEQMRGDMRAGFGSLQAQLEGTRGLLKRTERVVEIVTEQLLSEKSR